MKYFITISLLCFTIFGQLKAQGKSLENKDTERISLQKGQSKFGLSTNFNSSYSLVHRYAIKNNLLLRTSLNTPQIGFAQTDNQSHFSLGLGAAIGLEKHIYIGRKWSAYYGAELIFGLNKQDSFSAHAVNFSGLSGIKFNANERVSFFTELRSGYTFRRSKSGSNEVLNQISPASAINFGVLFTLGKK